MSQCPVDHLQLAKDSDRDQCPVDHQARSTWSSLLTSANPRAASASASASHAGGSGGTAVAGSGAGTSLPTEREVSSIPNAQGEHWVYPSQAQFYAAMARKQHNPRAEDMQVVVPIHNVVNERAWGEVMEWERGQGGEVCGGAKLVSFKGRPGDMTPRARFRSMLGYQAPFDRHDWIVNRCGTRVRYIIDFYTGRSLVGGQLAFYLDVRPALDNWEGVRMRATRFVDRWFGQFLPWHIYGPTPTRNKTSDK